MTKEERRFVDKLMKKYKAGEGIVLKDNAEQVLYRELLASDLIIPSQAFGNGAINFYGGEMFLTSKGLEEYRESLLSRMEKGNTWKLVKLIWGIAITIISLYASFKK
jgi:hypothetical protein